MPIGHVKWFDADKGFGFVTSDEGEAFLHSSALPKGVHPTPGTRLDYDVIDGKKGKQVLKARILENKPRTNRDAAKAAAMIDDVIKMLDETNAGLKQGRYPDPAYSLKVAEILRYIADDLEG